MSTSTDDDIFAEDEPMAAEGLAPDHGWDNDVDVAEAKRMCHAARGAFTGHESSKEHLFRFAGRLRNLGISPELAFKLIMKICEPTLDRTAVRAQVKLCYKVMVGKPGTWSNVKPDADDDDWLNAGSEDDDPDDTAWLNGGVPLGREGRQPWPRPLPYDQKQNHAKLAEMLLAARPGKLIASDDVLYSLQPDGIWHELPEKELAAEIRKTNPTLELDTPRIFGIIAAIKLACFTKARPFEWIEKPRDAPSPENAILFKNVILDSATGKLLPHTGNFFATAVPDFNYDPDAKCPLWLEKLSEWLHPSFHAALQEHTGYVMTSDTTYEVIAAKIGATRGGKGTISFVKQHLVGKDGCCSRSMNDLAGPFGLEGTLDKRYLTVPDSSDAEVQKRGVALERLKSISGNDVVSVNRKNNPIINARVPVKIELDANRHPKFLDDSGALAAREIIFVFNNSFKGREDRDLRAKLMAELPGIANWALEGLRRLRSQGGKFTIGERGRAAARELAESQSPMLRFARDHLIVTGDMADHVTLPDVYAVYAVWAREIEELRPNERRNRDDFKSDLMAALASHGVVHGRRRWHDPAKPKLGKGTLSRGFFGFRVRPVRVASDD